MSPFGRASSLPRNFFVHNDIFLSVELSKAGSAFTETIIFDSVRVPAWELFSLIIHKSNRKYKIYPLNQM